MAWYDSIIKYFPSRVTVTDSFFIVCSDDPTKWLKVLSPRFVDFKLKASSRTRLYLDIRPSPVSSSVLLLSPLLKNLNLSLLLSKQQYVLLHRHNISVQRKSSLNNPGSR